MLLTSNRSTTGKLGILDKPAPQKGLANTGWFELFEERSEYPIILAHRFRLEDSSALPALALACPPEP